MFVFFPDERAFVEDLIHHAVEHCTHVNGHGFSMTGGNLSGRPSGCPILARDASRPANSHRPKAETAIERRRTPVTH